MSDTSKLSLLGNAESKYQYDSPNPAILEVFANGHQEFPYVIGLDALEFTSLCPMTGQPDYGRIRIDYIADELCVESKSLKFYLVSYRNHGSFHEDCVNTIADDIFRVIKPHYLRVFGDFNVRGGISIKPMVIRQMPNQEVGLQSEIRALMENYDRLNPGRP